MLEICIEYMQANVVFVFFFFYLNEIKMTGKNKIGEERDVNQLYEVVSFLSAFLLFHLFSI